MKKILIVLGVLKKPNEIMNGVENNPEENSSTSVHSDLQQIEFMNKEDNFIWW